MSQRSVFWTGQRRRQFRQIAIRGSPFSGVAPQLFHVTLVAVSAKSTTANSKPTRGFSRFAQSTFSLQNLGPSIWGRLDLEHFPLDFALSQG
jgi:hypothetical protein